MIYRLRKCGVRSGVCVGKKFNELYDDPVAIIRLLLSEGGKATYAWKCISNIRSAKGSFEYSHITDYVHVFYLKIYIKSVII